MAHFTWQPYMMNEYVQVCMSILESVPSAPMHDQGQSSKNLEKLKETVKDRKSWREWTYKISKVVCD